MTRDPETGFGITLRAAFGGKKGICYNAGGLRFDFLKNNGLSGNVITSIAEFGDNLYVSTYAGLFWAKMDKLEFDD